MGAKFGKQFGFYPSYKGKTRSQPLAQASVLAQFFEKNAG